jgi:N-sulfoglucosamine sulfohydrolase
VKSIHLFIGLLLASNSHAVPRPNILFILTEDDSAQLSFLGTPQVRTPNLDSLARSGVYFKNFFVAYPVCSASKACIYTGLPNHVNGILNNTQNYFMPAGRLTAAQRENKLYLANRVHAGIPTLIERLHDAGYYQGVVGKLHVAPLEKFPYDEFLRPQNGASVAAFLARAKATGKPWHLFYNVEISHRPFPNRARVKIAPNPAAVKLPAYLADTPVVRQDWAEYLAGIEAADKLVGEALAALHASGLASNTVIICMSGDHGPAFPHGKMTLYDLGLRVTLSINWPGLTHPSVSDALVSELDFTPTLLDLLGLPPLPATQGVSLRAVLENPTTAPAHQYIFAEISDRGPLPNPGMQERSVFDGRWHLIYREHLAPPWRQVQADSKDWAVWRNRTYDETVKLQAQFPEQYRILAEMDPQSLHGTVHPIELYDLQADPDEMHDLAPAAAQRPELNRLYAALRQWAKDTQDSAIAVDDAVGQRP